MPLTVKQHGVMKGMIAAVIVAATGLGLGAVQYPQDWLPDGSPQARLTLAAQCLLAGAFWLLLSIGLLARHRFSHRRISTAAD